MIVQTIELEEVNVKLNFVCRDRVGSMVRDFPLQSQVEFNFLKFLVAIQHKPPFIGMQIFPICDSRQE